MEPGVALMLILAGLAALVAHQARPVLQPQPVLVRVDDNDAEPPAR
jgi:hypothetical protein